jgi:sulfate permease, SulP family
MNKTKQNKFIQDILAGLTVSFAALALGAAFGAMSGRGAFAGMIGAAVIPIITSLFGGTRLQASGPTGPMTAITALLVAHAYDHFSDRVLAEQFITLTIIMSGLFMILAGILKLGRFIKYVPNVIVIGFMNGIAVLIWWDQILKLFGWAGKKIMEGSTPVNLILAVSILATIFIIPMIVKKIGVPITYRSYFPAVLLSIFIGTLVATSVDLEVEKVKLGVSFNSLSDYGQILKSYFPSSEIFQWNYILMAIPLALQLMLLGYLDSLLTSLVIDRMTGEKTKESKELIGQGLANTFSGVLQGISGAQATIRSVLLIKEKAQTRLAGVLIGVFVLIWILFFKNMIALIPSAVFAGVLFKAGWDVVDREYFEVYFQKNWRRKFVRNFQMFLVLYTTIITVLYDLNVAVFSGTALFYLAKFFITKYKIKDVESEYADEMEG